jgi:signal transduction histidine kinase
MKKSKSMFLVMSSFVASQLAWMGMLGLWIYWYVSNYIIFKQVGDKVSPEIELNGPNVGIFVIGIVMIVGLAVALVIIFRNLLVQRKLTSLYDNFIANITHELKSPLSSIQLYLETLSSKKLSVEKQNEFYAIMAKDTTRLHKLINSILEVSRLEQKRVAHNFHIYDADNILSQIIDNSIKHFNLPEGVVITQGKTGSQCVIDKEAMQIVFDNFTDNAVKYTAGNVKINIKLKTFLKKIVIEFTDKGIGIGLKDQKTIFDKFHRINNKAIPNVKGTGLGLYWVKEIIRLHGGKTSVRSEGINKGTTFIIELPIYKTSKKMYIKSLLKGTAKKERYMETGDGE